MKLDGNGDGSFAEKLMKYAWKRADARSRDVFLAAVSDLFLNATDENAGYQAIEADGIEGSDDEYFSEER